VGKNPRPLSLKVPALGSGKPGTVASNGEIWGTQQSRGFTEFKGTEPTRATTHATALAAVTEYQTTKSGGGFVSEGGLDNAIVPNEKGIGERIPSRFELLEDKIRNECDERSGILF